LKKRKEPFLHLHRERGMRAASVFRSQKREEEGHLLPETIEGSSFSVALRNGRGGERKEYGVIILPFYQQARGGRKGSMRKSFLTQGGENAFSYLRERRGKKEKGTGTLHGGSTEKGMREDTG